MNNQLTNLVSELKKLSIKENVKIWKRIATDLEKPSRNRRVVNLSNLDRYTKETDVVIVPGKVLGGGEINHKVTIAAYTYSGSAKEKIVKAKGEALDLFEIMKKNPKGKNIRIIG